MEPTTSMAELLLEMDKFVVKKAAISFPAAGDKADVKLENEDGKVNFIVSIIRSRKNVEQSTFNLRYQKVYSIRRLDLQGNHTNPQEPAPAAFLEPYRGYRFRREDHVHVYQVGWRDQWAIPLSDFAALKIDDEDDMPTKLKKFLEFCNVKGATFTTLQMDI
jgi:hypothetical protein